MGKQNQLPQSGSAVNLVKQRRAFELQKLSFKAERAALTLQLAVNQFKDDFNYEPSSGIDFRTGNEKKVSLPGDEPSPSEAKADNPSDDAKIDKLLEEAKAK